jgi:hypothetical protein
MKNTFKLYATLASTLLVFGCSGGTNSNDKIAELIKNNCDCETVEPIIATYGITFSKEDASSLGQRYEFQITDCNTVNFEAQIDAIIKALKDSELCEDALIILELEDSLNFTKASIEDCSRLQ